MTTRDTAAVRAWARANGYPVAGRGRIPAEVARAYATAAPRPAPPPAEQLAELAAGFRALAADFGSLREDLDAVTDSVAGLTGRVAELDAADARAPRRHLLRSS